MADKAGKTDAGRAMGELLEGINGLNGEDVRLARKGLAL